MILLSSIVKAKMLDEGYELTGILESEEVIMTKEAQMIENRKENLEKQSEEILMQAVEKSRQIQLEAERRAKDILESAYKESRDIRMAAEMNGYEEGYLKGMEEGSQVAAEKAQTGLKELKGTIEAIKEEGRTALKFQEKYLIMLAFELVKKIMKQHAKIDKDTVYIMLEDIILDNQKGVTIYLSEYNSTLDIHIDKFLCNRIQNISPNNKLVIIKEETDVMMIETEKGIIDLNLNVQLERLKDAVQHA